MQMPYGKHKGKDIANIPVDYLIYVLNNHDKLSSSQKSEIQQTIDLDRRHGDKLSDAATEINRLKKQLNEKQTGVIKRSKMESLRTTSLKKYHPENADGDIEKYSFVFNIFKMILEEEE